MSTVSVIVPVLDEHDNIAALVIELAPWLQLGIEILIVDGGSRDGSPELLRRAGFMVIDCGRGRATQMNAGAKRASGDILLFLHADTRLPYAAIDLIQAALQPQTRVWGRFDVRIEGQSRLLGVIAWFINIRSRLTGLATGDQAVFVRKSVFESVGAYPEQPLMEDIALSSRLRDISRPACLRPPAVTSGRRWDSRGAWRTVILMWKLRWLYWRGVPAEQLSRLYR